MTASAGPIGPTDAVLVERVLAADREAFAEVYDRYGGKLFDFAYAMLRHREDAADAVADSFVLFAERLPQLRDPERLRPWLYAITRSECLRRLKARKRVAYGGEEQLIAMADDGLGPERRAEQAALRELVWAAAAGLADRDRALLDLHLRQGLEGAELGEAMGTTAANAYVMLTRLRAQVERSLGALLIARMGRDDCPDLASLLSEWDGTFTVLVRKRVARHVDGCAICAVLKRTMVSPWTLLASVPVFVAPAALRDRVLDVELVAWSGPAAAAGGATPTLARDRSPARERRGAWWADARLTALVGVLLFLLLLATVVRWSLAEVDDPGALPADGSVTDTVTPSSTPATSATPGASSTASATPTATPSATVSTTSPTSSVVPAPPVLSVSTTTVDLGTRSTSGTVTLRNDGGSTLAWSAASRAGWLRVSAGSGALEPGSSSRLTLTADRSGLPEGRSTTTVVISGAGQSRSVTVTLTEEHPPVVGRPATGADPSCQVTVTASVRDESPLDSVVLFWSGPAGKGQTTMSGSGTSWSAQIGPITTGGTYTLYVVARDVRGNASTGPSRSVYVNPCPG